jgi:hypothetical protein
MALAFTDGDRIVGYLESELDTEREFGLHPEESPGASKRLQESHARLLGRYCIVSRALLQRSTFPSCAN